MFNWLGKLLFGVDLKSLEKKVDDAQTAISQLKFPALGIATGRGVEQEQDCRSGKPLLRFAE